MAKRIIAGLGTVALYAAPFLRMLNGLLTWVSAPEEFHTFHRLLQEVFGPISVLELVSLLFGSICLAIALGWHPLKTGPDLEAAGTFSTTVFVNGMGTGLTPDTNEPYLYAVARLTNHSANQSRVLDFRLIISLPRSERRGVRVRIGPSKRVLRDYHARHPGEARVLENPLTLKPNEAVAGLIEFPVEDQQELDTMRKDIDRYGLILRVSDRVSHDKKDIPMGRTFDALRQRTYRGAPGESLDTLKWRWKRYRATGNLRELWVR
jgi:hypothetical protein